MPDWITHAATAIVLKRTDRKADYRLALLGAVLPDMLMPPRIVFLDMFDLPARDFLLLSTPYHSPFTMILVSLAIALFTRNVLVSWGMLAAFSVTHLIVDSFVAHYATYPMLGYPFFLGNITPAFIPFNSPVLYILPAVLAPLLIIIWRSQRYEPLFTFSLKRIAAAVSVTALTLGMILLTRTAVLNSEYHYLRFFDDPKAYEGKRVEFCVSRVVSEVPPKVTEMGQLFTLDTGGRYALKKDMTVSFDGVYQNGVIRIKALGIYEPRFKTVYSILMMLFIAILFARRLISRP
ncbi:MAG: hypothetical protein AABZ39_12510 [Spirochaetota bacterium]